MLSALTFTLGTSEFKRVFISFAIVFLYVRLSDWSNANCFLKINTFIFSSLSFNLLSKVLLLFLKNIDFSSKIYN